MTPETRPSRPYRRLGSQRWRVRVLVLLNAAAILAVALLLIYMLTQKTVTLKIGGDVRRIRTHDLTVRDVLDHAHVLLDPEDVVDPAPSTRLSGGETIVVHKAQAIAVEADGLMRQVRTQAAHPLDVLAEQSIIAGQYDVIQVDGRDFSRDRLEKIRWNTPLRYIRVIRSATVEVQDRGQTVLVHTTQDDVGRALDSMGLELYLADRVTPDLSTPVVDGLSVTIERSVPVTVAADGREITTRATGPTVGAALASIGMALIDLDYSIPPEESPLEPDMVIRIVRVTEEITSERESIPYTTERRPDPALKRGDEKILRTGRDGLRERQILVRYEDRQAVSKVVLYEAVIEPPVPRLVAYGPTPEH